MYAQMKTLFTFLLFFFGILPCSAVSCTGEYQNPKPTLSTVQEMWGSSGSDVFCVGSMGMIVHYDGSTWTEMTSGTSEPLYGIWGSAWDNVYAVGESGTLLHYDGSIWSALDSGTTEKRIDIWGASPTDSNSVTPRI